MKIIKSVINFYNKLSNIGKLLVLTAFLLIIIVLFKSFIPIKENFITDNKILIKSNEAVYDDFYADIYDYLVYSNVKNDYEVGTIINSTSPNEASIIADIGCGTGHHVKSLSENNLKVIGIDKSPSMIEYAKSQFPEGNFQVGDALDNGLFKMNSLTHILCLYFTIYFIKDKKHFFDNAMDWLMPGGFLIIHLVDREHFDPILPPGNPLYIVSPQKYAKERITSTKVTFNDFVYNANFNLDKENDTASFEEKFKFNDGKVRKQEHVLYMNDLGDIVNMAQDAGFLLHAKIDLLRVAYEYQYLYVFMKPG